jgi:hypothetical protein
MRVLGCLAAVGLSTFLFCGVASADIITFDDQGLTGPSTFAAAGNAKTIVVTTNPSGTTTTFTGGTILTNTTNLPADQTSIYGTAGFAHSGYTNPLVISFNKPVQNFIADLFNGSTIAASFLVADNVGDSATFLLPPNLAGGEHQVFFAAAGTQVTITQLTNDPNVSGFDFFVDNIQFDVPLPAVPEPSTFALLGLSVAALACWHRRKRTLATE